jgi:chromosome segregation ATPase
MINETLLRALQERMRKLTEASSANAVRDAELRAAVERAKLTDAEEAAQEAAATKETKQLAEEICALRNHVDHLVRYGTDNALVAGLQEELAELENKRAGLERRVEELKSGRHRVLENAMRELESAEQQHRHIADQAMRLREHIEKLAHG